MKGPNSPHNRPKYIRTYNYHDIKTMHKAYMKCIDSCESINGNETNRAINCIKKCRIKYRMNDEN